jgi:hypothetical protein
METRAKQIEEQKRNQVYDPLMRWKHYLEAIAWAESNKPPEQRRNRPRWRDEQGRVHFY